MTNAIKVLLQMTSVSLQPVPTLHICENKATQNCLLFYFSLQLHIRLNISSAYQLNKKLITVLVTFVKVPIHFSITAVKKHKGIDLHVSMYVHNTFFFKRESSKYPKRLNPQNELGSTESEYSHFSYFKTFSRKINFKDLFNTITINK
jgi:hypothetical protein